QLLVITALALAVILVTVALLLNAAVFTENVATQETAAEGRDALAFRADLVDGIGDLIETGNADGDYDSDDVSKGINNTAPLVERQYARHGIVANTSYNNTTAGDRLEWDGDGTFTDSEDNPIWRPVPDLNETRNFTVSVDPDDLENDPSNVEDQAFGVRLVNESDESGENVTQYVYKDGDEVVVDEANETQGPTRQCAIEADNPTTVDLTGDRLSNDSSTVECFRGLWADVPPEAIEFRNGDAAGGTFALTVDDASSPTDDSHVASTEAVYSATVDVVYQSPELTYESTVRIAPGEPR
ncbi:MAG: DUF7261 family protein, partial [Halohasta sp.]